MDFSWENMAGNLQDNAFNDKKTYDNDVDERFWKLSRDENGNGGAIIRFLPDANNLPFVSMTQINARKAQKGFFVKEWSPQTIGLPCPFNEEFSKEWKAGNKDTAKTLGRAFRFVTNIKILKDPANPENEGKIFLYDMSQSMMNSIKEVMVQTDAMKALDEEPIAVYNPLEGNNFIIKIKDGENDIPTYASSKFSDKVTGIYGTEAEAVKEITEGTYALSEFLDPSNFKTYDELCSLLDRFLKRGEFAPKLEGEEKAVQDASIDTGLSLGTTTTAEVKPEVKASVEAPSASNTDAEIDDLLADIA